jgi:hypothetical protein
VQPFIKALYALAGNAPALGLAEARIFYDQDRLQAGELWDDTIRSQLARADVFVLLVSNQSMTSRYCMAEELATAARSGTLVVPVLLEPTASWHTRPILGGPPGRTLGDFNGVPLREGTGPHPIHGGSWPTTAAACTTAVEQIAARLRHDDALPPLQAQAAARQPRVTLEPLLPSLCNQQPPADSFMDGLEEWPASRALLVLVKGEYADDTPGFWNRLREKNLAAHCRRAPGGRALAPVRPLELPAAYVEDRLQDNLPKAVRRAMSEALFDGDRGALRSGEDLAAVLQKATGIVPLQATLAAERPEGCAAVLQALLDLLDATPADTPLDRLVVAVLVENPGLVATTDVAGALALRTQPARRTHVVETHRLIALTGDEVKRWHRIHGLQTALQLNEEQLVQRLFKGAATLRHRPFDEEVRPMLGLTAKDPPP